MAAGDGHSRGEGSRGVRPGALSALLQELAAAPPSGGQGGEGWDAGLRAGAVVGRFELAREIGRGGFGVVWEAKDLELGRRVAFKAVRAGTRQDLREERLLLEAEAAARLSHPNIVTLHDVGRSEHGPYLVLELLEGETLAERLGEGALPVLDAVRIGFEVAKGLAHAHAHGVVHRDLKPENVFLCEDGQVKVLDLGMAHAFGRRRADGGTPAYMAPEQLAGAPEDERTDVFALGAILYEMLTGKQPFGEDTRRGAGHEAPEVDIPGVPALGALVARMLASSPLARPRDAGEVAEALAAIERNVARGAPPGRAHVRGRRWRRRILAALAAGVAALGIAAVVLLWGHRPSPVLPHGGGRTIVAVADFANETGERELDALSGLLITSLEQSRRLAILTRARMIDIARQGGREGVERIDEVLGREIGRRAGARALLVAAVHRFDGTYTVELRGIDPQRDEYLFTLVERAAAKSAIPDLIDRLGERARGELREPAADVAERHIHVAEAVTGNLEAYEHYFHGIQLQETVRYELAIAEFRAATRIDPTFALAYYRIAYVGVFQSLPAAETRAAIDTAMRHVERVPEKDRLLIQGWAAKIGGRNAEAQRIYAHAVAAYPDDKQVCYMAGEHLVHWGKIAESLPYFERAIALDPTWEWAYFHVVDDLLALGRFEEALARARRWAEERPDAGTWRWLSRALNANGRHAEAADAARRAVAAPPAPWNFPQYYSRLALVDALIGLERFDEAEEVLAPVVAPGAEAEGRARGLHALAEVLSYEGRRRDALRAADGLRFEGASPTNRLGVRMQQILGGGGSVLAEAEGALRLGVPGAQLATWVAMGGDLERAAALAAGLEPGSPERQLYEAVAARRRGDLSVATAGFRALSIHPSLDYAASSRFVLGEIEFAEGRYAEAIASLEAFARTPVVSVHWGLPPSEVYRWFFAGQFRSWAYPRSLYLRAAAHERLGEIDKARAVLDRLLGIWKRADPDLPLLAEARTMRRRLAASPASGRVATPAR